MQQNPDLTYAPSIEVLIDDNEEAISKHAVQTLRHFMMKQINM